MKHSLRVKPKAQSKDAPWFCNYKASNLAGWGETVSQSGAGALEGEYTRAPLFIHLRNSLILVPQVKPLGQRIMILATDMLSSSVGTWPQHSWSPFHPRLQQRALDQVGNRQRQPVKEISISPSNNYHAILKDWQIKIQDFTLLRSSFSSSWVFTIFFQCSICSSLTCFSCNLKRQYMCSGHTASRAV